MITILLAMCGLIVGLLMWFAVREARRLYLFMWMPGYLSQRPRNEEAKQLARKLGTTHILFCMVDHFEPVSYESTLEEERARMRTWLERYPRLTARHRDSIGRPPQHTWFYPIENYRAEYLDGLVGLCRQGLGEIEVHLHHGHDTGETLREKLRQGLINFSKHGAQVMQGGLSQTAYGFIHGNLALDNSRFDPTFCGVNNELTVLRETGCYADFSLPTIPCVSQSRKVNAIYYATDDPQQPKSFDTGIDIEVGGHRSGDLLLIPGPVALNWRQRKFKVFPRVENAEIQGSNPPTAHRVRLWVEQHIHVKGRPDWVVVKVSCHGAEERSWDALFGDPADEMYQTLESEYRDRSGYQLHYVTARELYNIVKAAEAGKSGNPSQYRNFMIPSYQTHNSMTV